MRSCLLRILALLLLVLPNLAARAHGVPYAEGELVQEQDGRSLVLDWSYMGILASNCTDGLDLQVGGDDGMKLIQERLNNLLELRYKGEILTPKFAWLPILRDGEGHGVRLAWQLPPECSQVSLECRAEVPGVCIWHYRDGAGKVAEQRHEEVFNRPVNIVIRPYSDTVVAVAPEIAVLSPAAAAIPPEIKPVVEAEAVVKTSSLSAWKLLGLGFRHIVPEGLDHILFIVSLFLLSPRLKPLFWQATAFTLAHSITLGLAMAGLFLLPSRWVETGIALSIVVMALGNLRNNEIKPHRWILVFSFGLVHGLGFAGSFAKICPAKGDLCRSLLCLNLGIEVAQVSILVLLTAFVWRIRQESWYHQCVTVPFSLLIAAIASWWVLQRAFGF